jgi:tetratricopeptide (TPR) repeat protein
LEREQNGELTKWWAAYCTFSPEPNPTRVGRAGAVCGQTPKDSANASEDTPSASTRDSVLCGCVARGAGESTGELDKALACYEKAADNLSCVRVHCMQGDFEAAKSLALASKDPAAAFHLGRHFDHQDNVREAIRFYTQVQETAPTQTATTSTNAQASSERTFLMATHQRRGAPPLSQ